MTAEQLRNSILQEAISGRLVPQDPNDEPASALLARIREEREILVTKKELKKADLTVSNIDTDVVFDIPDGWEWVTVDQIAIVKGGKRLPVGKTFSTEPTPYMYIRVTEMKNNTLIDCDHKYISKELRDFLGRYTISSADIYVTIAGTIGAVGDVPEKFDGMNLTENALKLSYLRVDKKYLIYALSSPLVQSQFKDKTNKVGQPKLAMERVKNSCFPLPPLAEQKRIVAKLEELLPIVEQYGKAQKELDELNAALPARLRQSILQEAISGRLVPQDPNDEPATALLQRIREERECLFKVGKIKKKDYHIYDMSDEEIPFELPQGWAWEKLGNLTEIISDGTHKTPHYVESGIPFLSVQNISGGQLDLSKIKYITQVEHEELIKRVKPQKGDLLICRIGTLGKAIKIYWDFEFSIFVSLGLIRLVDSSLADYISLIINSPIGNSWIQENKVGGGTHTFKINLGDIPNMMLPLPPLAEQQRIVAKIEELFAEIDKLTK